MANDIVLMDSGRPINNGSVVIKTPGTGYQVDSTRALNTPVIADIDDKYDARLDRPRYYTGDTEN